MALTDTEIRKAKVSGKRQRLFDGGGLYLELSPTGGKWWRFKYRVAGKEKLISLGVYPSTTLKEAREKRDAARKTLAAGSDPSIVRKAEMAARKAAVVNTLEAVARQWLSHRAPAWKPGTRDAIKASLENHVFPTLGGKSVAEVRPGDIRTVVTAIEAGGAAETAGRVFQRIRSIFRYAIAHEIATLDPTYPLKAAEIFKPRRVSHRASLAERDVPAFLHALDGYAGSQATKSALELLILTAVRPGELRGAAWVEFEPERGLWRIPAERMKMGSEHLVPLSRQALQVLETLRSIALSGELVFPSPFYPRKPISDGTLNSALARLGYKGMVSAHGFRTLFSTCANEGGWGSDIIERQLAHEERDDVRDAYNRAQYLEQRTNLMQWWGDRIDSMRKGADIRLFHAGQ